MTASVAEQNQINPPAPLRIFDAHTHAFPDAIAGRAVEALSRKADIPSFHDGTFLGLTAYESRAEGFLLLPIATKAAQTHTVNRWAVERAGGKAKVFGSIHPLCDHWAEQLDFLRAHGVKGIKMHPEYQDFYVDDPALFPLYEGLFDRHMILYLHAGVDIGFPPPVHGSPQRIARLCERFPAGRIIAAHMGGYLQYEQAKDCLLGRDNLWIDTSFAAQRMPKEQLRAFLRLQGKRALFGTDAPWADFDEALNAVLHAGLEETELANLLYHNAMALLEG